MFNLRKTASISLGEAIQGYSKNSNAQIEHCKNFAKENDLKVIKIYTDMGISETLKILTNEM